MPTEQITESNDQAFKEARIDSDSFTLRNISVINAKSRNNRIYSTRALDDIVKLIAEGPAKVFLNHHLNPSIRPVQDFTGQLTSPRRDGTKVVADLRVLRTAWPFIEALASQFPGSVGMSIDGKANVSPGAAQEGLDLVNSVSVLSSTDLVSDPASTSGIFESIQESLNSQRRSSKMASDVQKTCAVEWLCILGETRSKVESMNRSQLEKLVETHNEKLNRGDHQMSGKVSSRDLARLKVLDGEVFKSDASTQDISTKEVVDTLLGRGKNIFEAPLNRNPIPQRLLYRLDSLERELTSSQKARIIKQLRG